MKFFSWTCRPNTCVAAGGKGVRLSRRDVCTDGDQQDRKQHLHSRLHSDYMRFFVHGGHLSFSIALSYMSGLNSPSDESASLAFIARREFVTRVRVTSIQLRRRVIEREAHHLHRPVFRYWWSGSL